MNNEIITNFPVSVYGKMEKFSDTISKGRCRVFYKGRNRNGTYITDEFAQKLIDSAPYAPVKGIYDEGGEDYTDHGVKRSEGRIYGVVPADPNFAWEKHLDDDGIEREYACFDVLYYTALYQEAGQIHGKSESMELYRQTLKGDWQVIDGKKTYVFTDGCFLGLQALGDEVEPCFEGASFYTATNDNILALLEKYEKRTDLFQNHEQEGGTTMPSINFKISDEQKYNLLFDLLNLNFNEENGWLVEYGICEVYDAYAVVRNYAEQIFERVYYTKDDNTDSLIIDRKERCYIIDINDEEKALLDQQSAEKEATLNQLNETVDTLNATVTTLTEANDNLTAASAQYFVDIEQLNETISALTAEKDEINTNYENAQARIVSLEGQNATLNETVEALASEREGLAAFKKRVEDEAKKSVVETYVDHLSEEVIENYLNNLDNYTIEELDKELTYEQKKANPNLFTKTPAQVTGGYIPKDDDGGRGINDILARYEKH